MGKMRKIIYLRLITQMSLKKTFTISGSISEKIIDWHQTIIIKMIGKDVEWRTKTANIVAIVFEQKFVFESFGLHFWEINDWQQTKVLNWLWKMVKERQKTANTVPTHPTVFEQKFAFEVSKSHLSTLLLKVFTKKNTQKVPQITSFYN